jgi:hypothetical protein
MAQIFRLRKLRFVLSDDEFKMFTKEGIPQPHYSMRHATDSQLYGNSQIKIQI